MKSKLISWITYQFRNFMFWVIGTKKVFDVMIGFDFLLS